MNKYSSDWQRINIGDKLVCLDIKPGFACGEKDVDGGVPHLRMNNISSKGNVDFSLVRRIPKSTADGKNRWLRSGDVLFCNTNSTDLVGKACLFAGWKEPCAFSNHLTRLRVNEKTMLPEWLLLAIRQLWYAKYFAMNCREFIGQSAFNNDKLRKVEIPVPPLEEQRRIVARIEELNRRAEEARRLSVATRQELEIYQASLLAKAFRGEL
jgi:type I restriction enzyme S subunit